MSKDSGSLDGKFAFKIDVSQVSLLALYGVNYIIAQALFSIALTYIG